MQRVGARWLLQADRLGRARSPRALPERRRWARRARPGRVRAVLHQQELVFRQAEMQLRAAAQRGRALAASLQLVAAPRVQPRVAAQVCLLLVAAARRPR